MVDIRFSPYAPVRLRKDFWWLYAVEAAQHGAITPQGRIAASLPDHILQDLVVPSTRLAAESMKDDPNVGEIMGQMSARLTSLRHWVPLVGQYELCGRQIFDLTDDLVEMLAQTDVGDCTLEDWHPPYDAFYVRFGKRDDIRLPFEDDYEYLDGAFVAVSSLDTEGLQRRIKFGFSTVKGDGGGVMMPGLFFDFLEGELKLPISNAIEVSFQRKYAEFADNPAGSESGNALNAYRRDLLTDAREILQSATNLLINSLFYIESVGSPKRAEPGRDTPADLTVRWAQSPPEKRQKLRSTLTRDGYTVVYLIGQELTATGVPRATSTKRAHWRRGHWRQQPYGSGLQEKRRIWIKPTMIHQDVEHHEPPGHVYVTGGPGAGRTH
ncbi:TPA: hypothetical protein QDB23_001690 [Burkholderia vietnamiensis]|nr:hypothetical protein [Burkholderia vietnamiensis]